MLKRLLALLLAVTLALPAFGQVQSTVIRIDSTPVQNGTPTNCLTITTANKVGQAACGSGTAGNIQVGTTTVGGGTSGRVLYDNAGVLGEMTTTGSGTVLALQTSPSLVTPALGVATGTSLALGGATLGTNALAVTGTSEFGGNITVPVGAAATPAINFAGETNTGFFWNTTGVIDVSFTASPRMRFRVSQLQLGNAVQLGWSSATTVGTADLLVTRRAAATLNLGNTDAATPVAQTISTQGSRAGTDNNVGGGSLTIQAGTGTGIGTASSLILRSPVVVASGTGAQTVTTGLTIVSGTAVTAAYTVATLPATAATGARAHVTDALNAGACLFNTTIVAGGTTACPVFYNGTGWVGG